MKKFKITLLVLLLSAITGFVQAVVIPAGNILASYPSQHLPAGNYTLNPGTHIFLPVGKTFTIEPGVVMNFGANSIFSTGAGSNLIIMDSTEFVMDTQSMFDIKGDFFVYGLPGKEAYFHDVAAAAIKWRGINFVNCVTDTVFIDHAKIYNTGKFSPGPIANRAGGALCAEQSIFDIFEVHHTHFMGNDVSVSGGAVFFNLSSCNTRLLFADNIFAQNTSGGSGGAVHLNVQNTDVRFLGNTFVQNKAISGGAVYMYNGGGSILGFDNNQFTKNFANSFGGACFFTGNVVELVISRNMFNNNVANKFDGGAIYVAGLNHANPVTLMLNIFGGNTARLGGAVCTANDSGYDKNYFNNLFINNYANSEGGAVYCERQYAFVNNTFSNNSTAGTSGAIYAQTNLVNPSGISNNILWGDLPNEVNAVLSVGSAYPDFFYCDIDDPAMVGVGGAGCINANPLFVGAGDYHLQAASPCIDSGDPAFGPGAMYPLWTTDLDMTARVKGAYVDMGAYEYPVKITPHIHLLKPESPEAEQNLDIYPNPAVDKVNVSIEGDVQDNINIDIYDLTGKRMLHTEELTMKNSIISLDVTQIPDGIYLMKIETGDTRITKKLIVK